MEWVETRVSDDVTEGQQQYVKGEICRDVWFEDRQDAELEAVRAEDFHWERSGGTEAEMRTSEGQIMWFGLETKLERK